MLRSSDETARLVSVMPELCRDRPLVCAILPPTMHSPSCLRIAWKSLLSPSTISPPPPFFHRRATSSRTFSANPSSRHPDPQYFPTNVARACNEEDVIVRLCRFVKVLKATGLRVVAGNAMGRMGAALVVAVPLVTTGRTGWRGVANAGEEEGMALVGLAGVDLNLRPLASGARCRCCKSIFGKL